MQFELGLMTGTFYNMDIFSALQKAVDYKIKNVEILVSKNHFDVTDTRQANEVREYIYDTNIDVYSVHAPHTPYWHNMDITLSDESGRREAVNIVKMCIDFIASLPDLPNKRVVVHPGGELRHFDKFSQKTQFYKSFSEIVMYARSKNINIALENMLPHLFGGKLYDFTEILMPYRVFDNVGVCFDTSHANLTGDIAGYLTTILENFRIMEFHLSDNLGSRDDHLMPFDGEIDWTNVFRILQEHNGSRCFMFEINAPAIKNEDLYKKLNESVEKINTVFRSHN